MTRRSQEPVRSWQRHLDGWQIGAVIVLGAAVSALLAVPHATVSREIPMPTIDRGRQAAARAALFGRAEVASKTQLPYEVRAIGEALRRHGEVRARETLRSQDASPASTWTSDDVRSAAAAALAKHGAEPLLQLRALQTRLFLAAVEAYDPKRPPPVDLTELGGELLGGAQRTGWVGEHGLRATQDELQVWFSIRWSVLTGLREAPFAPTLNDWRIYYTFLLRPDHEPPGASWEEIMDYRERVLGSLAEHDPDYPVDLARGILACQRGDFARGAQQLRNYLRRSPEGPWSLRARNSLNAATSMLNFEPEPSEP